MQVSDEQEIRGICKDLKHMRQAAGWTQAELANRLGVTRQTITAIENNKMVPSLTLCLAIAGVFIVLATMSPILDSVVNTIGLKNIFKKIIQ
jgi:putative transcriptional regulator